MTRNKVKMRKHELRKQAYLAGLATMTVGALALSSGFVHADEQTATSGPSDEVNLVTKQETNQAGNVQASQEAENTEGNSEIQEPRKQVNQEPSAENQVATESEKVSEITGENVQAESEASSSAITTEVSEVSSREGEGSAIKKASVSTTVTKPATVAADSTYTLPVQGPISAGFDGYPGHGGIDYAVPEGTPVHAARDGVVKVAGANHPWMGWQGGNAVLIQHPDGMHTGYAHLSRIIVSVGQQVSQGQVIGYSGSTGLVTGPHLHFEMLPAMM